MSCAVNIDVCKASLDHQEEIVDLVYHALKNTQGFSLPLLPTRKNAEVFYRLEVIPCLINNDPAYLAYHGPNPIGFACCSLGANTAYDLSRPIALGVLTVTTTKYRRQGVATELRKSMLADLKQHNIESVLTEISDLNTESILSCQKLASDIDSAVFQISNKYECKI
jgi:hypothetical protein